VTAIGAWLATAAMLLSAAGAHAETGGFDAAALEAFALSNGGRDAPRVYAYRGTVYDAPSGRILATLDGYQIARAFPGGAPEPGTWYVVRRAFLLYRAPGTGDVLAYYPDVRAKTMPAPPLSIVRYRLDGDRVTSAALSGVRGSVRDITLPEQLSVAREEQAWVFRRVLSPPDPQQKPIELTETIYEPQRAGGPPRIRSVMTKVADNWGFLPPGGRHLLHLSWRPASTPDALAPLIRTLLDEDAPGMKSLPANLADAFAELGVTGLPPAAMAAASPSTLPGAATVH
jgi:hypothetical protein